MIEISLEISSEFPGSNNNWPSDISFYFNKTFLGKWTSPGNYSDVKGKYNPDWWPKRNSQYGLLKTIRIASDQTHIDGDILSDVTLDDIDLSQHLNELSIAVEADSQYVGGLTIFGEGFGNHPQDIKVTTFYSYFYKTPKIAFFRSHSLDFETFALSRLIHFIDSIIMININLLIVSSTIRGK